MDEEDKNLGDTSSDPGFHSEVTDEELLALIASGVQTSQGTWLNSNELTKERTMATNEYAMLPIGHLAPNSVSKIVSSDTTEIVDGYSAIIGKLMFSNNKIAKLFPLKNTVTAAHQAAVGSDLINYIIFKQNAGWEILNTWVKSSLLWKNALVKWDYVEDYSYEFEEYEEVTQDALDLLLADKDVEIVGALEQELKESSVIYTNVRLRRKTSKSGIKIYNIPPENFRISRDATCLDDASYIGIQQTLTRSDLRRLYPDVCEGLNWDEVGDGDTNWAQKFSLEQATRKRAVGLNYYAGATTKSLSPLEANKEVIVTESWLRVDRDGDGIAELKHIITAGDLILHEEDTSMVNLASICPIEIPHEFFGLSLADMARSSTLATTAIMRGFIENVYLTNHSPKLADPNMVDFSALQNIKPKQIIAASGPLQNAVQNLPPETISQGTVPMLQILQGNKEQATGMTKAAQGINDTLYVSGNSQEKLQAVQGAAQLRIEHIARRFAETGFKRLIEGVYMTARKYMKEDTLFQTSKGEFEFTDPSKLPAQMHFLTDIDVGDHSNSNTLKKMQMIGQQVIPALTAAGAGQVVKPTAAATIATKTLIAMDLDPSDFIEDPSTEDFRKKAEESRTQEMAAMQKKQQMDEQNLQLDIAQKKANVDFVALEAQNTSQDNIRGTVKALDEMDQAWAKLEADLIKECIKAGIQDTKTITALLPPRRTADELFALAGTVTGGAGALKAMTEQPSAPTSDTGIMPGPQQ